MTLYVAKLLPEHWIATDGGKLVMWPARQDGWAARSPYVGHKRALSEVPAYNAAGTGWPELERARAHRGSVEATYLLKLPAELDQRVRDAAEADGLSLAEWWRQAAIARLQ